jgi:hypothetical protein
MIIMPYEYKGFFGVGPYLLYPDVASVRGLVMWAIRSEAMLFSKVSYTAIGTAPAVL